MDARLLEGRFAAESVAKTIQNFFRAMYHATHLSPEKLRNHPEEATKFANAVCDRINIPRNEANKDAVLAQLIANHKSI